MKFKDYINKKEDINEGYVSDELGIRVEWIVFSEDYSIVLDASSTKDAMQALQHIEKYGDKALMDENGDMRDPDDMLKGFKKLIGKYGKVKIEE